MDLISPLLLRAAASVGAGSSLGFLIVFLGRTLDRAAQNDTGGRTSSFHLQYLRRQAQVQSPLFAFVLPLVITIGVVIRKRMPPSLRTYLSSAYDKAGSPGGLGTDELAALALLVSTGLAILLGLCGMAVVGPLGLSAALLGAPLGPLLVVTSLQARATLRRRQFSLAIPYVLDLIVLTLRAGASLNLSLRKVVADYVDHPVGEEFGQVLVEMEHGLPRADAFARLSQRLEDPDMVALLDSIVQSEELGWPLAQTIERLADRLNIQRTLKAEETAGSAGVLVMLPSTLVLMSAILMLFGPTIVRALRGGLSLQ
jgi:tight adherence protein C